MEQKRPAARVQQGFLHGAFILMFGVLLVKAIGALFKIPLSRIITEDGMGYFSTAYSFFNVLFSLSTVGFPVAVARLTAAEDALGRFRDVRQIKAAALPVFSVIGVLCALLMASFAPLYTRLVQSPGALFSMLALAPCAALCSISSVYRGYFEGLRNMLPTAFAGCGIARQAHFRAFRRDFCDAYGHTGAASERHGIRLYREK